MKYHNWTPDMSGKIVTELKDYSGRESLKLYCSGFSEEKYPLKRDRNHIQKIG